MTQPFSQFLGKDDAGNMRMRLGFTNYIQKRTNENTEYFIENKDGSVTKLSIDFLNAKKWIQQNFEREFDYQRRKELAMILQRTHIPEHERRAWKKSRVRGWNNSTSWKN